MNGFEQRNSYGGSHGLMDSIDTNTGETAAYETPEQSEDSANTGAANGMGNMDNVGNMNGMNAGISDMYSQPQQGNYQQAAWALLRAVTTTQMPTQARLIYQSTILSAPRATSLRLSGTYSA